MLPGRHPNPYKRLRHRRRLSPKNARNPAEHHSSTTRYEEGSAFIDEQGKESLNFQISLLTFILIGFALLPLVGITGIVLVVMVSLRTNKGESFRYPLSIRFLN